MDAFMTPFYTVNRCATPPDSQEVADAVARVIAHPAGKRPLHTVVAPVAQRQAPQAVNDAATQATHSFFQRLDIPLATIMPREEHQEQAQRGARSLWTIQRRSRWDQASRPRARLRARSSGPRSPRPG